MTGLLDDFESPAPTPFEEWLAATPFPRGVHVPTLKIGWDAAMASLSKPRPNGHHPRANGHVVMRDAVCSGCGKPYQAYRVVPGRRGYCTDCRATGIPASDRARDFRLRKQQAEE